MEMNEYMILLKSSELELHYQMQFSGGWVTSQQEKIQLVYFKFCQQVSLFLWSEWINSEILYVLTYIHVLLIFITIFISKCWESQVFSNPGYL